MTTDTPRIAMLDFLRGIAVMGILVANLPAFALPESAYFSPLAWGGSGAADRAAWFFTFVAVEGKMRGLFSLLFGASMLLVIDRARLSGEHPAGVHYRRMAVLFAIGVAHLYLIWWGDILAHYALVGAVAFAFHRLSARWLVVLGVALVGYEWLGTGLATADLFASAARDTPAAVATWDGFAYGFGVPPRADLIAEVQAFRSVPAAIAWRWQNSTTPFAFFELLWPQTLAAMLLGMAAYRSGFVTGAWPRARYRRWAIFCLGIALPAYAALGVQTMREGFDQRWVFFASIFAATPIRILATIGYVALLALLFRADGAISLRIAAVGRAAFTNYLGTSLLMTALFTGCAQFGRWPRAELYLVVPVMWGIMLAWSPAWLARYRFGPLEWVWRSAARMERQAIRRGIATP